MHCFGHGEETRLSSDSILTPRPIQEHNSKDQSYHFYLNFDSFPLPICIVLTLFDLP